MTVPGAPETGYWYGGDYNPEQWPEEVRREDMALMRRAGVTLATVGVFSWSLLEPEEGRYDFGWLDRVLDDLHANGVRAALATPTASPPPWFGPAYPDALPVTADGVRLTHGSRDTYCVCAPAYAVASRRIARALAARYGRHPALALWHVHNEYGTWCHCDHVARAFRTWLRDRYGALAALNEAWTTAFWSQRYADWDQIQPPRATQYLPNPAHRLDFRRFLSDAMLGHYRAQRDVLRAAAPGVPVTTNFAYGGWVPVDPWTWAEHLDLVAVDHYPDETGLAAAEQTAFAADLARSWAGRRPWLLMEQAAGVTYTAGGRTRPKAAGELTRHSLAHLARGSRGAMFFQWRASRGGAEQWHAGMVPHAGPDSRVFREVCALGGLLPRLAAARDADVATGAAVLWDPECWWALDAPSLPSSGIDYLAAVRQAHRVLWRAGCTVDFAAPVREEGRPLGVSAPLLVVPALYLASDATARALTEYVAAGGTLVAGYLSGVADTFGRVRTGGYPGALRDLLGVRVEEFHPLGPEESVPLAVDAGRPELGAGSDWSERVHLAGAEAVAGYAAGPLAGLPAVTRHRHGAGTAWYVSTRLSDDAFGRLLGLAAPHVAGAPGAGAVPAGVEVVRRHRDGTAWVFVLNHTEAAHRLDVEGLGLRRGARDLVSGAPAEGLRLAAGGVAVLEGRPLA
ncbi:beta-galactosidase [Marinactinospora rubrisoli]|uniref:Beta-galactosidase n=1 Tax=Marinactinospora rubrisoli TaxID=2715399 RepID=A0ABW2KEI9_9ACTN